MDGSVVGTFVSGRGAERESNEIKKDCFAAMVRPDGAPDLLVTAGRTPWSTRYCHGIADIGLIPPSRSSPVRFGIVYHSHIVDAHNKPVHTPEPYDPVVLAWTAAHGLQVDVEATRRAASAEAKTVKDILRAIN